MQRNHYNKRRVAKLFRKRVADKKKAKEEETESKKEDDTAGDVSGTLRRRMGDPLADLFSEAGRELYARTVEAMKSVLRENFDAAIPTLDSNITDELGRRGREQATEHYPQWINEMVENLISKGMHEAAIALEDLANSFAADKAAGPDETDELTMVGPEDVEEVEEVEEEDIEAVDEEAPEDEEDLEDLFGEEASTGRNYRRHIRRRKPSRR